MIGTNLEIIEVENGWAVFKDTFAKDRQYMKPVYVATTLEGLLEIIRKRYETIDSVTGEVVKK